MFPLVHSDLKQQLILHFILFNSSNIFLIIRSIYIKLYKSFNKLKIKINAERQYH